jgi:hypothetical protein
MSGGVQIRVFGYGVLAIVPVSATSSSVPPLVQL